MSLFLSPHLSLVTLPVGLPMLLVFGHSSPSRVSKPCPRHSDVYVRSLPNLAHNSLSAMDIARRCPVSHHLPHSIVSFYFPYQSGPTQPALAVKGSVPVWMHLLTVCPFTAAVVLRRRRDDLIEGNSKLKASSFEGSNLGSNFKKAQASAGPLGTHAGSRSKEKKRSNDITVSKIS
ncbi:hypothetical protein B0H13DRAFT_1913592 [Mycena leptocephala]|nr:hypothetical protein B0H13DRAFT_1913592 [Mycena leptocephala]